MKKKSNIKQNQLSIPSTITMLSNKTNHTSNYPNSVMNSNTKDQSIKIPRPSARVQNHKINMPIQHLDQSEQFNLYQKKSAHKKLARSISSFSKKDMNPYSQIIKDSPHKKSSLSRFRTKNQEQGPYEKIIELFATNINSPNEQQLIKTTLKKFDRARIILTQSLQNGQMFNFLEQIRLYLFSVIDQLVGFSYQKLLSYELKIQSLIKEYETKLFQQELATKQKIMSNILCGQTEISRNILSLKMKALFSTKVFNEMSKTGINLEGWISNSKLMETYISIFDGQTTSQIEESKEGPFQTVKINEEADNNLGVFEKMGSIQQRKFLIKQQISEKRGKTENIKKKYITHQITKKATNQFDAENSFRGQQFQNNQEFGLNRTYT